MKEVEIINSGKNSGNSKYNAITHGILKESISDYEKLDYQGIYAGLEAEYKPEGMTEHLLIQMATTAIIKNNRINKAEAEIMRSKLEPAVMKQTGGPKRFDELDEVYTQVSGYTPVVTEQTISGFQNYSRYQTANENRFYRAITALKAIQREKMLKSVS